MDGNGRWAKRRHLPRAEGHRQGVLALRNVIEFAATRGVKALTVFAFSSENWRRPEPEVETLMRLFAYSLHRWEGELGEAGLSIRVVGDLEPFPEDVKAAIASAEKATAAGKTMQINIAANYGGRWDICQAAARVAKSGLEMTPKNLESMLATNYAGSAAGDVDLLIRTGGEQRISNFLLWQTAYAEIFFCGSLWPDFGEAEFDEALRWFEGRERRFGMISEQIKAMKDEALD